MAIISTYNADKGLPSLKWMSIAGIIFGFIYCFAIGANDVANSFGSSVSAKSLTIPQAIVVATIMEAAGAILLGASVTDTIKNKILNTSYYTGEYGLIMTGMLAALIIGSFWLLLATYLQLPVSTTHTIVASICGFTYAAKGWKSINWPNLRLIFITWGASPSFAFAVGFCFFIIVKYLVLRGRDPFARTCIAYPVVVGIGVGIEVFLVINKSNNRITKNSITGSSAGRHWTKTVSIPSAIGSGVGCALITFFLVIPLLKPRIERKHRERLAAEEAARQAEEDIAMKKAEGQDVEEEEGEAAAEVIEPSKMGKIAKAWNWFASNTYKQDLEAQSFAENRRSEKIWASQPDFDPRSEYLFQYVQVFTACLNAFAHGSNDVANGVGPLSAILSIQKGGYGSKSSVDYWILAVGGAAIGLGFIFFGYRIIKAVGYKLTKISPSRGACLELAAAICVSVASYLSIPVSSTQCLVGATAGVAFASGGCKAVEWIWLITIGFSWAGIFFMAAIFTGLFMALIIYSPGYVAVVSYQVLKSGKNVTTGNLTTYG